MASSFEKDMAHLFPLRKQETKILYFFTSRTNLKIYMHVDIHGGTIYNSEDLETAQVPSAR